MQLIDKYSWTDRFRKGIGSMVLGASILLSATMVEANMSITYEGCRGEDGNGYAGKMVPDVHPGHPDYMMYFCNQDEYQPWSMGTWHELDMVPFHIIVENKSKVPETFTFKAGGHYSLHGTNAGWDWVTEFSLDEEATIAEGGDVTMCKQYGAQTSQDIILEDGNIYRTVTVTDFPPGLICVPTFNMRLAMGSSANSGASLHGLLHTVPEGGGHVGTKSLPIKVGETATFSKTMNAVSSDTENTWTIAKEATPATINFGDTCEEEVSLERDVQITVTWEKISTGLDGKVTVTTVITATNTAKREIGISVVDNLYGIDEVNPLATANCQKLLTANSTETVCTNIFKIDPVDAKNLHDIAVATYDDPDHTKVPVAYTSEATASTDDPTAGSATNANATIEEHEWITGADLSYEVVSVTGASGDFTNYTLGDVTNEHIGWVSDSQSDSGSIVFNKKVHVNKATITDGYLSDRATIQGSDSSGIEDEATATISLESSRRLEVTLTKEITEARDTATDFSFDIMNPDGYDRTVTLTISAGQTSVSEKYTDVDAVLYNVQEVAQTGWEAVGDATKPVDLRGEACKASVAFTNQRADRFINVKVKKLTFPEKIGSEDQSAGWTMTLSREISPDTWEVVSTEDTVAGAWVTLADETTLIAGNYKIEEKMKDGWYNKGISRDCTFTYDGNPEQQDFECTYANAKESTIIISKETDGDTATKFGFTQTINKDILTLSGDESKTYEGLRSGTYQVTENDPGENFVLSSLSCVDPSNNSRTDQHLRTATIQLDPGETVECTYRNIELKDEPSIDIEKLTNGEDADDAPGPNVLVGDPIKWEYIVTNSGNVKLNNINVTDDIEDIITCPSTTLKIGESMICVHNGIATLGQYENVGTVTSDEDEDSDPSHYLGTSKTVDEPSIVIEKLTNGEDADEAPGPNVLVGDTITWEYIVTNNGNVKLNNIVVTDDKEGAISCPLTTLEIGESMICTHTGIAVAGQYGNVGRVTSDESDDNDTSHYLGYNEGEIPDNKDCPCNDVESDSSSTFGTVSAALMILMTLMLGLFFVRREELNTNER